MSAALVLLMTPGVAFFYAGMLRRTNALGIIMQSFCALGVVSIGWAALGFSVAFSQGNGWLGDLRFAGLTVASTGDLVPGLPDLTVPTLAFVIYQMMGAVITPALVIGATAERWRFSAYLLFLVLWPLLVYAPVAHWVFSPNGWASQLGALDFAGGIVVHANAGAAAIAMAMLLGRRVGWPERQESPHSVPLVMIGTGLLWFGWIGYNGGSALAANGLAAAAATNTHLGGAAALLTWIAVERIQKGTSTVLGAGCGAVAGLVAVTPAAGYIAPSAAIFIGAAAGVVCCLAVGIKSRLNLDDSLDVVAVHLVGGSLGTVCVGFFATKGVNPKGADGLFYGGGLKLLGVQVLALVAVVGYSLGATLLIGWLTGRLFGNRVSARHERAGLDLSQHGEVAYSPGTPEATNAADLPPDPDTSSVVASTAPENLPPTASNDGKARGRPAETHSADYLPDLASSLNSLGVQLSELGRHAEAAAAIEEAVAAYRRLAQTSHNAYQPEFATALDSLSARLEELSQQEEGRASIDEAITVVYRRLAQSNPDTFLPDLAAALNKQSIHLDEQGRREESLAAVEEAVTIYRRLAHINPDTFLPELAAALNKQSIHLVEQGRREECMAAVEEAVTIYRRLAHINPDAFLPGLAASLINLERLRPQPSEHERAQPDQSGGQAVPVSQVTWLISEPTPPADTKIGRPL